MITVIIVAAGRAVRFGAPKQFIELAGKPLVCWSIDAFDNSPQVSHIVVAAPPEQVNLVKELVGHHLKVTAVVPGGASRTESVRSALLAAPADTTVVLVHDAARPFVSPALIDRILSALGGFDGVVPALPVTDTIKVVEGELVLRTIDRTTLRAVQTPQAFSVEAIKSAHEQARRSRRTATDDASLLESAGYRVRVVEGDDRNIKITHPGDLTRAEAIAAAEDLGITDRHDT